MVLAGLLSGLALQVTQSSSNNNDCMASTTQQLAGINGAIERFVLASNRYPLPALRTVGVENPAYGREVLPVNISQLDTTATTPSVTYGALPFQALGLAPSFGSDCWGNKFTYAVTTDLTDATKFLSAAPLYEGGIAVRSSSTVTLLANAGYAVISHGPDGVGAVKANYQDSDKRWCTPGSVIERLNCSASGNAIAATGFNDGKDAADALFDDLVVYKAKPDVVTVNGACDNSAPNRCAQGLLGSPDNATCGDTHWSCTGIHGGTTDPNCHFSLAPCIVPEPGVCGLGLFSCASSGPSINNNPGCPGPLAAWTCAGIGGAPDASCTAPSTCPVAGGWGAFGACSAPCGPGTHTRACDSPPPANGGAPCPGNATEACDNGSCSLPVAGECGSTSNTCNPGHGSAINFTPGACGGLDTWICDGLNGGPPSPLCSAPTAPCPINGECGSTSNTCTLDHGTSVSFVKGACGTQDTWICDGSNGGSPSPLCSAAAAACCLADGQSSGGDASACCNGDSDGNGICGAQATGQCGANTSYTTGHFTCQSGAVNNRIWFHSGGDVCGEAYYWSCGNVNCVSDVHFFCFLPHVLITMADGSQKIITDLEIGDAVRGHTQINHVLKLADFTSDQPVYGFNGGRKFVTGGHPFYTTKGWKAINPRLTPKEGHNVKTTKLKVGDKLLLASGKSFKILSIDKEESGEHELYSPVMDGDHTYYADGYLVHNKTQNGGPCYPQVQPPTPCITTGGYSVGDDTLCCSGNLSANGTCL